jgi:hypothetical protein
MKKYLLAAAAAAVALALQFSPVLLAGAVDAPTPEWCNSHHAEDGAVLWNLAPGTCALYYAHRDDPLWSYKMEVGKERAERDMQTGGIK